MPLKPASAGAAPIPPIQTVRGRRVVLDSDLAALDGVPTMVFNQAIKRNAARFPSDFAFQLTSKDLADLRSQTVISSSEVPHGSGSQSVSLKTHGGRRSLPWVFTEHGAIMAATILNSPRAVQMSLFVVRAFVRMRDELLTNAVVLKRLAQIDKKLLEHDLVLRDVVEKLLPLLDAPPAPEPSKRRIEF